MLFDLRTYRTRPGTVHLQLEHYAKYGFEVQRRHLGEPLFYGVVETGDVNAYMHIWRYENAGNREERRRALYSDPQWLSYREKSAQLGYQTEQHSMLLTPALFWAALGDT
jgi:hypothetical protein